MVSIGALNLVIFIMAQAVGIGILASGSFYGLIPIFGSSGSGYVGLKWLAEEIKK